MAGAGLARAGVLLCPPIEVRFPGVMFKAELLQLDDHILPKDGTTHFYPRGLQVRLLGVHWFDAWYFKNEFCQGGCSAVPNTSVLASRPDVRLMVVRRFNAWHALLGRVQIFLPGWVSCCACGFDLRLDLHGRAPAVDRGSVPTA